jgi:hypothetical protein
VSWARSPTPQTSVAVSATTDRKNIDVSDKGV